MKKRFSLEIFLVAFLVVLLDQITKFHILKVLSLGESIPIIKGIFHLSLVYNTGIAFGLFKANAQLFFIATALVVIVLIFILNLDSKNLKLKFSLALILGGAIGNLIDRIRFGYVVDFLDLRIWPVFNVADSAITVGGVILFFILLREGQVTPSP